MTTDTKAMARCNFTPYGMAQAVDGHYVSFTHHERVVGELVELAEVLNYLALSKDEFPDWPDGWDWARIDSVLGRFKGVE